MKILKANGYLMKCGAAPKMRWSDAEFFLKKILHSRRENGSDSRVVLIYLVKACDRIKHEVVSIALKSIDAPDRLIKWVKKTCSDFNVALEISREDTSFDHSSIVTQGGTSQQLCLSWSHNWLLKKFWNNLKWAKCKFQQPNETLPTLEWQNCMSKRT